MGSTTVAIPASTAGKLADAAADDVKRHLEEGREASARVRARAADALIHAWNEGDGGNLVAVDSSHVSAAITCETTPKSVRRAARAFLVNAGVWQTTEERLAESEHDSLIEEVEAFLAE